MRIGNKKIFHLEAWVVKVMSLYKVCPASHATRRALVADAAGDSTSSTTSTWTASTSKHYESTLVSACLSSSVFLSARRCYRSVAVRLVFVFLYQGIRCIVVEFFSMCA